METQSSGSRREFLASAGCGFGLLALADLLVEAGPAVGRRRARSGNAALRGSPASSRRRAKRCIFLYMPGGPSQVDLFDPKPRLAENNGQPLPFAKPKLERTRTGNLLASPWKFSRARPVRHRGERAVAAMAARIDDLCVIRSMVADNINHTGAASRCAPASRPSLGRASARGSSTGLAPRTRTCPPSWSSAPPRFPGRAALELEFLPSAYQGTLVRDLKNPIANLATPPATAQRSAPSSTRSRRLNELHKQDRVIDSQLDARIASFELAFRMQTRSTGSVRHLRVRRGDAKALRHRQPDHRAVRPAVPDGPAAGGTRRALRAALQTRRRITPGIITAACAKDLPKQLRRRRSADRRAADRSEGARAARRHARRLGRRVRPHADRRGQQRPRASSVRLHDVAGRRRRRGGIVHGATDEFGWHAVHDKVHVHDLHATILHLMGFDHEKLTYRHGGRDYRLTDVHGQVVRDILV